MEVGGDVDVGESMDAIHDGMADLTLQAVVDENIDWEDVTADLTWGDDVDHVMEEVLM